MPVDLEAVRDIIEKHDYEETSLLAILQDIQSAFNYLPQKALRDSILRSRSQGMNLCPPWPLGHIGLDPVGKDDSLVFPHEMTYDVRAKLLGGKNDVPSENEGSPR